MVPEPATLCRTEVLVVIVNHVVPVGALVHPVWWRKEPAVVENFMGSR